MTLIEAQQKLLALNVPVLETNDVAACLKITITHASKILHRLEQAKCIVKLTKGKWAMKAIDPFLLPDYLTSPFPSYVSLQSALFYHGMISQIPAIIYAVSIARSKRYTTPLGTVSIHHIRPDFFFGFDFIPKTEIKMASPEKALLDIFYLSPSRSLLFQTLPELELPKNFSRKKLNEFAKKIGSKQRQTIIKRKINDLLK